MCNAAEGEPGTFKDRAMMRNDPYQVVEGLAIAAATTGARDAFIGLKASFTREREAMTRAVVEMERAGLLDGVTVTIVAGPEEYLFGEEKALLEVIEGNDPLPRWLPPYLHGLFATSPQLGWEARGGGSDEDARSNPTLVNNVETLACVTNVLAGGADWFRSLGTPSSTGNILCTVTGDVDRAGVVEVELGTPLVDVLDHFGAPRAGHEVKAVLSGASNPVLAGSRLDTPVSYEGLVGRLRTRFGRVHRLRRHRVHGARRVPVRALPLGGVLWPVPAVQARHRCHRPRARGVRGRRRR